MQQAEPIQVQRLVERKAEMEAEFQKGQATLQRQEFAVEQTRATLMRIQGALTILTELLAEASPEPKIVNVERVRRSKDGRGSDAEVPDPIP